MNMTLFENFQTLILSFAYFALLGLSTPLHQEAVVVAGKMTLRPLKKAKSLSFHFKSFAVIKLIIA